MVVVVIKAACKPYDGVYRPLIVLHHLQTAYKLYSCIKMVCKLVS